VRFEELPVDKQSNVFKLFSIGADRDGELQSGMERASKNRMIVSTNILEDKIGRGIKMRKISVFIVKNLTFLTYSP